ncbi:hypothetical protein BGZ88_006892, partial [Linnemannia elongata]
ADSVWCTRLSMMTEKRTLLRHSRTIVLEENSSARSTCSAPQESTTISSIISGLSMTQAESCHSLSSVAQWTFSVFFAAEAGSHTQRSVTLDWESPQ